MKPTIETYIRNVLLSYKVKNTNSKNTMIGIERLVKNTNQRKFFVKFMGKHYFIDGKVSEVTTPSMIELFEANHKMISADII